MNNYTLTRGSTSQTVEFDIFDSSTEGDRLAGVAYGDITAYYYRQNAASSTAITLATMTLGTWATGGFIVIDATNIPAPSSTKNKEKQRDPEMKSTRKNNQYFFGMKIHLGSDVNSNAIHSATVTSANVADIDEMPTLIRESDEVGFADAGYTSDSYKRGARSMGICWKVNDKRKPKKNMSSRQKKRNRRNSQVRARVEHCFGVLKCRFGYRKARYKGLEKNRVQVFALLGLANLYMLRKSLAG